MWVNIDIEFFDIEKIVDCLSSIFQEYDQEIILTFNTINPQYVVEDLVSVLIRACEQRKIPIIIGPQFVEEGLLEEGRLTIVDELYFSTKGEKIIWYLKNRHLPIRIKGIVLVNEILDIDPIILKRHENNTECEYYFLYEKSVIPNIEELIKASNYHFARIREKRED